MNRRRPAQAESHPRIFAGGWPGLSCSLRRLGQFGEALRTNMHSRLPPFRTERGRMGHPSCLCDLDLHLERVATFQSQVSSKTMIWELSGCRPYGEEHVVVLAAVEGRVEVDEVYRLVLDVLAQDFEVVAVMELVFLHCGKILMRIGRLRNCQSVCAVETPGSIPGAASGRGVLRLRICFASRRRCCAQDDNVWAWPAGRAGCSESLRALTSAVHGLTRLADF